MPKGYYSVFYPKQKISVKDRYFFFTSLMDKTESKGRQYPGRVLGERVNELLQNGAREELENKQNNEGLTVIQQALSFLKETIHFEQEQEIKYYETHIKNNQKMPEGIKKKLNEFVTRNQDGFLEIDYLNFINWLNIFYNGLEEYKYNLNYENERLTEVNELIQEFKALSMREKRKIKKQVKEASKNSDKDESESFYQNFKFFLLEKMKKNNSGEYLDTEGAEKAKKILDSKTILNQIQTEFKNTFNEIWGSPELITFLQNLILKTDSSIEGIKQETIGFLLSNFMTTFPSKIIELISQTRTQDAPPSIIKKEYLKKIAKQFVESLDINNTTTSDFNTQEMESILNRAKKIQREANADEALKKRMFGGLDPNSIIGYSKGENRNGRETAKQGGIIGLTQEAINSIEPIVNAMINQNKVAKKQVGDQKAGETRRAYLLRKLVALNPQVRDNTDKKHIKINYGEMQKYIRQIIESNQILKVEIKAKDNLLSEIASANGLITNLSNIKATQLPITGLLDGTQKSDTAILELGQISITPQLPNNKIEQISQQMYDNFINNNKINGTNKNLTIELYDEKAARLEKGFIVEEFFLEGETDRRILGLQNTFNQVKQNLIDSGASSQQIEQTLRELKNSFQISTTVKSYDKYDNDIGFHGGSLGGSLEHQLENIYKMFELGGITTPDIDWLTFAIYNSGNRTIGGNEIRNKIEDLLSTVAVMLLFDDAGQQAEYIKTQAKERYDVASTNFLHLYYLNGFYFPASFILQLTYNGLVEAEQQLEGTLKINSNGSRANIINHVSENDMAGAQNLKNKRIYVTNPYEWEKTFEENKGKVKIQLTFLAGLLDIIEQLENNMINITG